MNRLIRLQLRNVFHNKLLYVCLGLNILGSFVGSVLVKGTFRVFPKIVEFLTSEVGFISTVFIALFCCLDYSDGTTKNIIARGYTRMQLFLTKVIVSFIGLLAMYGVISLLYVFLYIKNGFGFDVTLLYTFINCLVGIFAYVVFCGTLSFLIEKNGSAIIASLFIPDLIPAALMLIDSKLKLNIGDYWMTSASSRFVSNPTLANLSWSILYYIIYIAIFIFIGSQILKKKEIK